MNQFVTSWNVSHLAVWLAVLGSVSFVALGAITQPLPTDQTRREHAATAEVVTTPKSEPFFEANRGQADVAVKFLSRDRGSTLFVMPREVVVVPRIATSWAPHVTTTSETGAEPGGWGAEALRIRFEGASAEPRIVGGGRLPGVVNYFRGSDPGSWLREIPTYSRVRYEDLYPGVDLVLHRRGGELEVDFELGRATEPETITLSFGGASRVALRADGSASIDHGRVEFSLGAPKIFQVGEKGGKEVDGGFRLLPRGRLGFRVGSYDPGTKLVIDPVLSFASYLGGGSADTASAIGLDSAGNPVLVGTTNSIDFPRSNDIGGAVGGYEVFVTKLDRSGRNVEFTTVLGGGGDDQGRGVDVLADGSIVVAGLTTSRNFPAASPLFGAYQGGRFDAFVTKLSSTGDALVFSTYLGGSDFDDAIDVTVDSRGDFYLTGRTTSRNFPTVRPLFGGYSGGPYDCFLTKLDGSGTAVHFSTYLGGSGEEHCDEVAVDDTGEVYIVGLTSSRNFPRAAALQPTHGGGYWDATVTKVAADGQSLLFSTFLGGSGGDDQGRGLVLGGDGTVYVSGVTNSGNFPRVDSLFPSYGGGRWDGFLSALSSDGQTLLFSTYLGGSGEEQILGMASDADGRVVVGGFTTSSDFRGAVDPLRPYRGDRDAFLALVDTAQGSMDLFGFLGGSGRDAGNGVAVDRSGAAWIVGSTSSTDFPTEQAVQGVYGGGTFDSFVAKVSARGFLGFPLQGFTPYSAPISGILDHSIAHGYYCQDVHLRQDGCLPPVPRSCSSRARGRACFLGGDGVVRAFTGTEGRSAFLSGRECNAQCEPGLAACGAVRSSCGYPDEHREPFSSDKLGGLNYVGVSSLGGPVFLQYDGHSGYDYPAARGEKILAPSAGELRRVGKGGDPINGRPATFNTFKIVHPPRGGFVYETWYLHAERASVAGEGTVVEGQTVGEVGCTGLEREGLCPAHLHFEVRRYPVGGDPVGDAEVVDPYAEGLWK